jgi:DNA-directed RNA polymerase specialized sigma24 family protein
MRNSNTTWFHWTPSDDRFLAYHWPLTRLSVRDIADKLDRTESAVKQRAAALGLGRKRRMNTPPDEALAFIKQNIGKMSVRQMAEKLGYSPQGVYSMAHRNNVSFRQRKD